jgi:(1->4)-alpha-D-glucan 1-alpha-D-glucosylmutase
VIPRATMRLQLHQDFNFADAQAQIDYYAALGISHLYLSPIFTARPGSQHGYDVTNFQHINPELGGEARFYAFADATKSAGLGLILDIVPNHMAASPEHNLWWRDVLQHGRSSQYATYFDIDWSPPDQILHNKVLLPMLARPYPQALRRGTLELAHDESGTPFIRCHSVSLPLAPGSVEDWHALTPAERKALCNPRTTTGRAQLHALLERQHYRVAWWRTARDILNWRRFFEVSELVGVCVEREHVFNDVHALVFRLMQEGYIDGVRVDHIDGLADPAGYCQRLRARLNALSPQSRPWIVVEKILAHEEHLPTDWEVDGTTGYDAMSDISAVLHDAEGIERLRNLWEHWSGVRRDGPAQTAATRRALVKEALVTEWRRATEALERAAQANAAARDLTGPSLARALTELLAQLPVYRTYFARHRPAQRSQSITLRRSAAHARAELRRDDWPALAFVVRLIEGTRRSETIMDLARTRVQQTMPPVSAKAIEDTLFYRDGTLLSRNEVGTEPSAPALSAEAFYARIQARAQDFPNTMLATATHDHKRGEDSRMRLAVISELPQLWRSHIARLEARRPSVPGTRGDAPDEVDRLMLYQALVGAWPLDLYNPHTQPETCDAFLTRIRAWQRKSIREAGRHGDWSHPDETYEAAADAFLTALQESGLDHIASLAQRLSVSGALNSLAQVCLQLCLPGVPDRYQGTETWDLTLVDPDNRNPVDYTRLRNHLGANTDWAQLVTEWRDGRIKQRLISTLLKVRTTHEALFASPGLTPLEITGTHAHRVLAFSRGNGEQRIVVCTTRLAAELLEGSDVPHVSPRRWANTSVVLPDLAGEWQDCLSGAVYPARPSCALSDLFSCLPVAVLLAASS